MTRFSYVWLLAVAIFFGFPVIIQPATAQTRVAANPKSTPAPLRQEIFPKFSDLPKNKPFPNSLEGKDHFIIVESNTSKVRPALKQDCKANIRRSLCLVEDSKNTPLQAFTFGTDTKPYERPCLPGGEAYIPLFEHTYDKLPPIYQKMFCSLNYIFIEKNYNASTAYASLIVDTQDNPVGAIIGFNKTILDRQSSLAHWATWKEQLPFRQNPPIDYQPIASLIQVETSLPSLPHGEDALYYVLVHETSHLFDMSNKINEYSPRSWRATFANDFYQFPYHPCYYNCPTANTILPVLKQRVYDTLYASPLMTLYGTVNPMEDFAESATFYIMKNYLDNVQYRINILNRKPESTIDRILSLSATEWITSEGNFINEAEQEFGLSFTEMNTEGVTDMPLSENPPDRQISPEQARSYFEDAPIDEESQSTDTAESILPADPSDVHIVNLFSPEEPHRIYTSPLYDVMAKVNSPQFAPRYRYLNNFFSHPERIVYP